MLAANLWHAQFLPYTDPVADLIQTKGDTIKPINTDPVVNMRNGIDGLDCVPLGWYVSDIGRKQ
jgi:hypothetical protein